VVHHFGRIDNLMMCAAESVRSYLSQTTIPLVPTIGVTVEIFLQKMLPSGLRNGILCVVEMMIMVRTPFTYKFLRQHVRKRNPLR
jgi:hypothetical protein